MSFINNVAFRIFYFYKINLIFQCFEFYNVTEEVGIKGDTADYYGSGVSVMEGFKKTFEEAPKTSLA